jgi:Dyp-type peroxidase family
MSRPLELDQIQGIVLRERPMPYVGSYVLVAIDDSEQALTLLSRLLPHVTSAADWANPADRAWINVVFTHDGLRRLRMPEAVLAGFPKEFRQPMRERAAFLGDTGLSDPANWDFPPVETFHVGLLLMAPDQAAFDEKLKIGKTALAGLSGIRQVHRLDIVTPPNLREHFGYRDGLSRPFIEGEGGTPKPGQGDPVKSGEFLLGYVNELGRVAAGPGPEAFWRNGTYVSIRKLRQDVAGFRRFLHEQGGDAAGQELLAAKLVGRWRSGAPLALAPDADAPRLTDDPDKVNAFDYRDDPRGARTPTGSHIRRVNPRDALEDTIVQVRLHRLLRRGATYGPALPEGSLQDDGVDRGLILAMINADPARQFEFVQSQWINDGNFISSGTEKDPVAGTQPTAGGEYRYPCRPARRHLTGLPSFAVTRGGENVFLPGLAGLAHLATGRW